MFWHGLFGGRDQLRYILVGCWEPPHGMRLWGQLCALQAPSLARRFYHSSCPQLMMRESFMSCPHTPGVGHVLLLTHCRRTQSLFLDLPLLNAAQDDRMKNKCLSDGHSITSCKIRSYFPNREQLWANFWMLFNHMKTV